MLEPLLPQEVHDEDTRTELLAVPDTDAPLTPIVAEAEAEAEPGPPPRDADRL